MLSIAFTCLWSIVQKDTARACVKLWSYRVLTAVLLGEPAASGAYMFWKSRSAHSRRDDRLMPRLAWLPRRYCCAGPAAKVHLRSGEVRIGRGSVAQQE